MSKLYQHFPEKCNFIALKQDENKKKKVYLITFFRENSSNKHLCVYHKVNIAYSTYLSLYFTAQQEECTPCLLFNLSYKSLVNVHNVHLILIFFLFLFAVGGENIPAYILYTYIHTYTYIYK